MRVCIACGSPHLRVERTRWTIIIICKNCDAILLVDKEVWDKGKRKLLGDEEA